MNNKVKYIVLGCIGILITLAIIFAIMANYKQSHPKENKNESQSTFKLNENDLKNAVNKSKVKMVGSKQAKNTVFVFSDYRCPDCYDFHNKSKHIINELIKNKKIKYAEIPYRVIDKQSDHFASLDIAASQVLNDKDYMKFKNDAFEEAAYDEPNLKKALKSLSQKDQDKIMNKYDQSYKINNNIGQSFNIHSTPQIFVNGKKVESSKQLKQELK